MRGPILSSKCDDFTIVDSLLDIYEFSPVGEIFNVNVSFVKLLQTDLASVRERMIADGESTVVLDYKFDQAKKELMISSLTPYHHKHPRLAGKKLEEIYSFLANKYRPVEALRKFVLEIYPGAKAIATSNEEAQTIWDFFELDYVFSEHISLLSTRS